MKRTATTSDRLHDELFTQAFWPCSSSWQIIPRSLDRALRSGEPGVRWLVIVVLDVNQSAAELEFALPDTRGSTPVAKHGFGQ